jgi:peroxiredoxin Q/BCP
MVEEGKPAPDFELKTDSGESVKLSDFRGKPVVLYFYPKDDTPGCTKEACAFRDSFAAFRRRRVEVLGVSTDDAKAHKKFAEKYDLPFRLLADPEQRIVKSYGVWGEKSMYGRKYMGTHRVTYLIDEKGKIAAVWPKVKPDQHARQLLETINVSS